MLFLRKIELESCLLGAVKLRRIRPIGGNDATDRTPRWQMLVRRNMLRRIKQEVNKQTGV